MPFPEQRPRRLRRTPAMRRLVAETRVAVDDLVAPLFVTEGITAPDIVPPHLLHKVCRCSYKSQSYCLGYMAHA